MKIAHISPYRDGTGYSYAAIGNILAADAAGIEVVPRAVTMSPPKAMDLPPRLLELERGTLEGIQAVVQYNLPHTFERRSGVLNVGCFAWETSHFNFSQWASSCNLMDQCWVLCRQSRQAALDSGVMVPISVVPHACDLARYARKTAPLEHAAFKNKCVFYAVGENTRRKNLVGLLRAYYNAFSSRHNVILVIKTSFPGMNDAQQEAQGKQMVADIKRAIHMHREESLYPPVVLITKRWSESQIDALHATGHVFVFPSRAESWCVPAHDAMGFGNPVIASNWGSFPELLYPVAEEYFDPATQLFRHPGDIETGWLIPGQLTPCFGQEGLSDLYTGGEFWFEPDLKFLGDAMHAAYEMWRQGKLRLKGEAAARRASEFSYEKVGAIIRQRLREGGVL